jgi:hypothetical protein
MSAGGRQEAALSAVAFQRIWPLWTRTMDDGRRMVRTADNDHPDAVPVRRNTRTCGPCLRALSAWWTVMLPAGIPPVGCRRRGSAGMPREDAHPAAWRAAARHRRLAAGIPQAGWTLRSWIVCVPTQTSLL